MRRIQPLPIMIAAVGIATLVGCSPTSVPSITSDPAPSPSSPAPESTGTADPSASASASAAPSASATEGDDDGSASPITEADVLNAWDPMRLANTPVAVWGDGFSTVRVFSAGSSSPACQPTGDDVEVEGDRLDIDFEEPEGEQDCPADLAVFGWEFTLPSEGSAAITTARIDGLGADGEVTVDIQPAD